MRAPGRRRSRRLLLAAALVALAGCADAADASAAEGCVDASEEVFETEVSSAADRTVVLVPWANAAAACLVSRGWTCTSQARCRTEDHAVDLRLEVAERLGATGTG